MHREWPVEGGCGGQHLYPGPGGIHAFAPDGTHLGSIELAVATSNCAWGGDGSTLYITAGTAIYRIALRTKGVRCQTSHCDPLPLSFLPSGRNETPYTKTTEAKDAKPAVHAGRREGEVMLARKLSSITTVFRAWRAALALWLGGFPMALCPVPRQATNLNYRKGVNQ